MVTDKILNKFFEENGSQEIILSDYEKLIQERRDMFARQLLEALIC